MGDSILSQPSDSPSETTNWLTRYQIRLPSCLTRDELPVYFNQQFFFNQMSDAEVPSVVYDDVFTYSDPDSSHSNFCTFYHIILYFILGANGLLDQGMIASSTESSNATADAHTDQPPFAFARSSLTLKDLQVIHPVVPFFL